jgi:UDP-glucose 4-epimerase
VAAAIEHERHQAAAERHPVALILNVAAGRPHLSGSDYDAPDGTCIGSGLEWKNVAR